MDVSSDVVYSDNKLERINFSRRGIVKSNTLQSLKRTSLLDWEEDPYMLREKNRLQKSNIV